jgi:hypothetical protein
MKDNGVLQNFLRDELFIYAEHFCFQFQESYAVAILSFGFLLSRFIKFKAARY